MITLFEKLKNLIRNKKKYRIILDTSALNSSKSMEIIEDASKVIILTGTIKEMDNHKTAGGIFGNNLRAVARKNREDVNSEKFISKAGYERYSYQDDNIIDYCRKHKKTVILTSDNNLCNRAKAYGIKYMFMPHEEQLKAVEEQQSVVEKENIQEGKEQQSELELKVVSVAIPKKEESKIQKHIHINEKSMYVDSQKGFYAYNFLEKTAGITDKLNDFEEEDYLYEVLCSKKKQYMRIVQYKIIKNDSTYDCKQIQEAEVSCINEIFRLHFSEEVKDEILDIFKKNCI